MTQKKRAFSQKKIYDLIIINTINQNRWQIKIWNQLKQRVNYTKTREKEYIINLKARIHWQKKILVLHEDNCITQQGEYFSCENVV